MKSKLLLVLIIIGSLFLISCGPNPPDDLSMYKGIAEMPNNCVQYGNDVCGLFGCMVDRCWCDDGNFPDAVLAEGETVISDEQGAMDVVKEYADLNVERAVKLNNVFYNVFADDEGNEIVYTVAVDGTIIKTICGV